MNSSSDSDKVYVPLSPPGAQNVPLRQVVRRLVLAGSAESQQPTANKPIDPLQKFQPLRPFQQGSQHNRASSINRDRFAKQSKKNPMSSFYRKHRADN